MIANDGDSIVFGDDGLVPAVVQDDETGDVLMVAFMNAEAWERTRETGLTHFWSRSRRKLWRKGETSGHEQRVLEIRINCERNTLLLRVAQRGAVCHAGYPTCFYRRLNADGSMSIIHDRWFDPADVYAQPAGLATLTNIWLGAYEALAGDSDAAAVSSTARRLRDREPVIQRIADELRELAGVLDGTHRHAGPHEDTLLEASQVLYWVAIDALQHGATWGTLRPDRALDVETAEFEGEPIARLLRSEADRWAAGSIAADRAAAAHAVIGLVAQACRAMGIEPRDPIERDLADLRAKPYLAAYFA